MKTPIFVVGAGGHAKVVAEIALAAGFDLIGFFDDSVKISPIKGYPILGTINDIKQRVGKNDFVIIAVGENNTRTNIVARLPNYLRFATVIHPSAIISSSSTIREGTVVMPGVVVNAGAKIGRHVILNTSCSVDHDCTVRDFAHISPGAVLCGGVDIGKGVHVGAGASIIPGCRVGDWSVIGSGGAVVSDIPERVIAVGVPAQVIRKVGE